MLRLALLSISVPTLFAAAACSDSHSGTTPDAGTDAGTTPIELVQPQPIGYAVVSNDVNFQTSSVTFLDLDGKVTKKDCITSATAAPGATAALSGDVVLPSWPQANNEVVLIDQTAGVLSWLDPTSCAVKRQLDVSTGFISNPHDVIAVATNKSYVTRFNPNAAAGKKPFDGGNDILIIDPSKPAITGRIDMTSYATQLAGTTIYSRPDRAIVADGKLYVTLANLSADSLTTGPARIVIIDVQTDKVTGTIDIPTLNNCTSPVYIADKHLLDISCQGAFADPTTQVSQSGLVTIDVSQSPPAITHTVSATKYNEAVNSYSALARDGALGFVVLAGVSSLKTVDTIITVDTATDAATTLKAASSTFVYGTALVDPVKQHVLVTDATSTAPGVLVYSYTDTGTPTLATTTGVSATLPRILQAR